MRSNPSEPERILISGMGPTALATAWEALRAGKTVLMISDRKKDDFVREQRVSLDEVSRNYLLSMWQQRYKNPHDASIDREDEQFVRALNDAATVSLCDIEKFIMRRLKEIPGGRIECEYKSELTNINLARGTAEISPARGASGSAKKVSFKYLIGADGAKHHAANVLNSPLIRYQPLTDIPNHRFHGSIRIKLARKDGQPLKFPEKEFLAHNSSGSKSLTWAASIEPPKKENPSTVFVNIGCELPEDLFHQIQNYHKAEDKKSIEEAVEAHLQAALNDHPELRALNQGQLTVQLATAEAKQDEAKEKTQQRNRLNLQVFEMSSTQMEQATTAGIRFKTSAGEYFFIVAGDSFRSSNYTLGHGTNDGLHDAREVGSVLRGTQDIHQYNLHLSARATALSWRSWFRNLVTRIANNIWTWIVEHVAQSYRGKMDKETIRRLDPDQTEASKELKEPLHLRENHFDSTQQIISEAHIPPSSNFSPVDSASSPTVTGETTSVNSQNQKQQPHDEEDEGEIDTKHPPVPPGPTHEN